MTAKCFRRPIFLMTAGLMTLSLAGCDQSFNPKGTYNEQLVVYSILTTRSDTQFVRVFTTYNPSGHNPLENTLDTYIRDARVMLVRGSDSTLLSSSAIPRSDKSRYTDDVVGYMAYPYAVQPGKSYTLKVSTDKGVAEAAIAVPARGEIAASNPYVLKDPHKYDEDLEARLRLSSGAWGYLARVILEFETRRGDVVTRYRQEIPSAALSGDTASSSFEYPILAGRSEDSYITYEIASFNVDAYKMFLSVLENRYGTITITGATYILTQVDRNLYTYFNLANGYQDPYSIRTDLPDYTNIRGGIGVFGAMVEDSLHVDLTAVN